MVRCLHIRMDVNLALVQSTEDFRLTNVLGGTGVLSRASVLGIPALCLLIGPTISGARVVLEDPRRLIAIKKVEYFFVD